MDKYEYQLKTEHIRQVAARKEYDEAAKLCDTIDWTKIRDVKMLTLAADVYTAVGEYDKAIDILQQAYQYAAMGRRIVYRLTELALKAGSYDDAKNYFEEFCRIAPNDQGRYILLYKMARFQKATLEEKITILEAYKREDFDEKWAYELAVLYAMNDDKDKCIQLCDDIILWFGLGKYVEKALSLKSQFAPLTPAQKEKVQKFANKKAEEENEKRQKEQERKQKESNPAEKEATKEKILKWQAEQEKAYQAEQEAAQREAKAREAEQKAALQREEQLRLEREKEKAIKEEQAREDARKAAERLKEQKEREEQERLQREQEEREAVERLKKAQRQEHARRSVVTSDMNEIMAVIQRARQEDAQSDLQAVLAQEVQQVQQQNAEEEKVQAKAKAEEEVEETAEETTAEEPITEEQTEVSDALEQTTVDEIAEDETLEEEAKESSVETPEEAAKESSAETPEETAKEPEMSTEEVDAFSEASDTAEITSEYPAYENADELMTETDEIQFEEMETPVEMESEVSEEPEYDEFDSDEAEVEPEYEDADIEAAPEYEEAESDMEETEDAEDIEEAQATQKTDADDKSDAVEEPDADEEQEATEELQQISDEDDATAETSIEEYEEKRQAERAGNAGLPIVNPEDLSRVWHFAIQAMPGEDDIELALEYLQELAECSPRAVPQSVVKITGQKLNQKGLVQSLDKLLGKTILIENAAEMNDRVINEFCKIIDPTDRSLLVVFIDTPASIRHLLLEHPQLAQTVTAQFVRETYSVSELLEYARGYADREDSVLDKSGELALMERLKVISENQERNKKRIVEMIVNNAIEKAEKKSMRRLFQSKYDKRGCLILRDKDFEVG